PIGSADTSVSGMNTSISLRSISSTNRRRRKSKNEDGCQDNRVHFRARHSRYSRRGVRRVARFEDFRHALERGRAFPSEREDGRAVLLAFEGNITLWAIYRL